MDIKNAIKGVNNMRNENREKKDKHRKLYFLEYICQKNDEKYLLFLERD